ncbi:hypothetical protein BH23BAC4_BH23BAC4_11060 [soil metagenome]
MPLPQEYDNFEEHDRRTERTGTLTSASAGGLFHNLINARGRNVTVSRMMARGLLLVVVVADSHRPISQHNWKRLVH